MISLKQIFNTGVLLLVSTIPFSVKYDTIFGKLKTVYGIKLTRNW